MKSTTTNAYDLATEMREGNKSYVDIARALNKQGHRTTTGLKWTGGTVYFLLRDGSSDTEYPVVATKAQTKQVEPGFKFENSEHHMLESIKSLMSLPVSTTKRLGMIRAVLE